MTRDPAKAAAGLSRTAFEQLLARLDPDPTGAAAQYNRHRERLIRYFGWQGCLDAEALADDVLDRVARRLNEGEAIERPGAYVLGVARLVVLEQRARTEQQRGALAEYHRRQAAMVAERPDEAKGMSCLDHCLGRLAPDRRALILDYYAGTAAERRGRRQALGDRLRLHPGALRNRALRIRQELERCVERCLHASPRDVEGISVTSISDRDDGSGAR